MWLIRLNESMGAFTRDATVRLSSGWLFTTDPNDIGVVENWYDAETILPNAHSVTVPHVWQEHDELHEYTGTAWYRRSFSLDQKPEGRMLLRFGAADYEATVWLNGTKIGANRGGYLPFVFDVSDTLRDGTNVLTVRVHDPEDVTEIPHGKQGEPWYTRVSGIWQRVSLVEVPKTYVASIQATPNLGDDSVCIAIEVAGDTRDDLEAHVSVTQDGEPIGSARGSLVDGNSDVIVDLNDPKYWTPETPALCEITINLLADDEALDSYSDYFGMRSIAVQDGDLYLNGDPLYLRGALDQAYYPETLYRPDGSISYQQEIEIAKSLGINLLRKHIKPAHPDFIEKADRLGLLVWEEPANPDVFTDRSKREVREQFEGMIERDYNRPSVVIVSLYNEEWGIGNDQTTSISDDMRLWNDEDKQEYLATFYSDAQELDPTRLICDNSGWAHVNTDINDYHEYFIVPDRVDAWRDRLDVIGASPEDNYATTRYDDPETAPIVVSEFGTWGLPNIERLREQAGGDPKWFFSDFLEGLKRPVDIDDRFESSTFSDTFGDLSSLSTAWQRRELASIEETIRDMRTTTDISGYILTEFTDIEWEFNGILDYRREPKQGLIEGFAAVNAPVTAWAAPQKRVLWDDETVVADIVLVNDTQDSIPVLLEWEAFDRSGTLEVDIEEHSVKRVTRAIDVPIPSIETPQTEPITVHLLEQDVTTTTDVVTAPVETSLPDVTVATDNELLAAELTKRGHVLVSCDTADVTIRTGTTGPDTDDTLVLPDSNGRFGDVSFPVTTLPERESWNLCASFISQTLFEGVDVVPGWAFDGLYPHTYTENVGTDDTVHVAYTEGWLANSGAISLTRSNGDNTLGICSLRLVDKYGEHPMATAVLDRLLEQFL